MTSRSPLREAPLRQAGQFLDDSFNRTWDEINEAFILITTVVMVLSVQWFQWYTGRMINVWMLTAALIPFAIYAVRQIILLLKTANRLKKGREGERYLGQHLETLRKDGFEVLHDLKLNGLNLNVDHILIGPKGVYAIETKAIWKRATLRKAVITTDGKTVRIGGYTPDRNPISQAKLEASRLHDLIKEQTGINCWVKPVVIYLGWFVEPSPDNSVWVLNEKALPTFLKNEPTKLSDEQVGKIYSALCGHVRSTNIPKGL